MDKTEQLVFDNIKIVKTDTVAIDIHNDLEKTLFERILANYGERCINVDDNCPVCYAWKCYDKMWKAIN